MSESILTMAKDLALAQITAGHATPDSLTELLQSTYAMLQNLQDREQRGPTAVSLPTPVDWKKSITKHAITCLECGAHFKQLSRRHLRLHDLNGRSYRTKFGIPPAQPLAARETTARRRQIVQRIRPWERSPTYPKTKPKATTKKKPRGGQGRTAAKNGRRKSRA
jgi:predicted transcriptional regulator